MFATPGEPPAAATAGANFAPVVVDVEAANGSIANQFNGPVTIALATGQTGTFDGISVLTVNAVNGVATFSSLAIDTAGTYTVDASSPNLTDGLSTSIAIVPNVPAQLAWTTEPLATATEGFPFAATVQVEDEYNNLETDYNQNMSLSLDFSGNADPADLGGKTTIPAVGGVASFSDIVINNVGDPYTLVASTGGLATPSTSSSIDVVAPTIIPGTMGDPTTTAGVGLSITWSARRRAPGDGHCRRVVQPGRPGPRPVRQHGRQLQRPGGDHVAHRSGSRSATSAARHWWRTPRGSTPPCRR